MAAVIYPSSLPDPSVSIVTPAERRSLSDLPGGPRQVRSLQRDYLATQRVEWSALTADEAAILHAWWTDTLTHGGAWFASTWPCPQGWVSIVRRFMGAPQWTHLPGGIWRVSAEVQVRGRGMFPDDNVLLTVDLDAVGNAGTTPAVGQWLIGLNPLTAYTLSLPAGLTHVAWARNTAATEWLHNFRVTDEFDVETEFGTGTVYGSASAARAAFPGGVISGASAYRFWIPDNEPVDNHDGLSIRVE